MADPIIPDEGDSNVRSISERAQNGDGVAPEEELFPMGTLEGEGPTAQTIIKKGAATEVTVSLSKAEVPNPGGGLFDPNQYGRALVTFLPGPHHPLPVRNDKADPAKVTGWKIRQDLRVVHVAGADNAAGLIETEFEALLSDDAAAAGALLDRLTAAFREASQAA